MEELEQVTEAAEMAEVTEKEEQAVPAETTEEPTAEDLRAALLEANVKLALLLCGAAKERLDEAAKIAYGLCALGKTPAEAAAEVLAGYPHFMAVQRELPQFSAQGGGYNDGFSAIRSIFARK